MLHRHVVGLGEAAQQRQREGRLDEPGARDDARRVEAHPLAAVEVQVDDQPGRSGLDLGDVADHLLEAALLQPVLDHVGPAAPLRGGALEHPGEEVHALLEGEAAEGVDAAAVEQAAGHVQVLLLRLRVAA